MEPRIQYAQTNPKGLFIHPSALHGVLLGMSRTHLTWTRPDRSWPPAGS